MAGTNWCGYDRELVWTNNTGGADPLDRLGRLHSDTAFENVRQVEVDLLSMRRVDGVSVQGGVAAAGAPSRGLACLYWTWGLFFLPFALRLLILLLQLLLLLGGEGGGREAEICAGRMQRLVSGVLHVRERRSAARRRQQLAAASTSQCFQAQPPSVSAGRHQSARWPAPASSSKQ